MYDAEPSTKRTGPPPPGALLDYDRPQGTLFLRLLRAPGSWPVRVKQTLLLVGALLTLGAAGLMPLEPSLPLPGANAATSAATRSDFVDLAFGRVDELTRWNRPIHIGLAEGTTRADSAEVARIAAEVEAITGITIRIAYVAPNVVVRMVPKAEFAEHVGDYDPHAGGATELWWRPNDHAVLGAVVVIDPAQVDRRAALRHEIMHLAGLRGHSKDPRSALYLTSSATEFTPSDRTALRLLYSPRLVPGMSRAAVDAALRKAAF
jgi:hypothetical protein